MKIAVSATGKNLDCAVDTRFGRCANFIVVETDDMNYEVFENKNAALSGSAGIQSASFVASQGVQCVLTGNCGPKAADVFSSAGIDLYTGQQGIVRDVVENFKSGHVEATGTNVPEKFGTAANGQMPPGTQESFGRGMGMSSGGKCMGGGGGRGMGGGGGRGMGGGGGRGMTSTGASSQSGASADTVEQLKQQARILKQQMEAIESQIKDLE
jgi:predicted Fe-Mo cluster-binding NifX family protein